MNIFFRERTQLEDPPEPTRAEQLNECQQRRKDVQARLHQKLADIEVAVRQVRVEEGRWRAIKREADAIDAELYAYKLEGLLP